MILKNICIHYTSFSKAFTLVSKHLSPDTVGNRRMLYYDQDTLACMMYLAMLNLVSMLFNCLPCSPACAAARN
jgi:hypothetical protein